MTTPPSWTGRSPRSVAEGPTGILRIACDPAAEQLQWKDQSGTAGRVVWPVGQELSPLLLGEAPSRDLARTREPIRRIDVPDPPSAGVGDHHDAVAVGGERGCGIPVAHWTRSTMGDAFPGPVRDRNAAASF